MQTENEKLDTSKYVGLGVNEGHGIKNRYLDKDYSQP